MTVLEGFETLAYPTGLSLIEIVPLEDELDEDDDELEEEEPDDEDEPEELDDEEPTAVFT